MQRWFIGMLLIVGLTALGCTKDDPARSTEEEAPEKTLTVGMPAPPIQAERWARGEPLKAFEPGKVYIVEFWATWCVPCLHSMGHLQELVNKHKDAGLEVIAVTTTDDRGNTQEAIDSFLAGRGKDLPFRFAVCEAPDTAENYLHASRNTMLPASFVVDQKGQVAYFGHPDELDIVLPSLLAGTWNISTDARGLREQEAEFQTIMGKVEDTVELAQARAGSGPQAMALVNRALGQAAAKATEELAEFLKKYPNQRQRSIVVLNYARMLLLSKKVGEARELVTPVLERALARRNGLELQMIVSLWADPNVNTERRFPELAVRAADGVLEMEAERGPGTYMLAAQAYYFAGHKSEGDRYSQLALQQVTDPRRRNTMQEQLAELAKLAQK